MTRILVAWELGSGLGHLARLQPIIDALCQAGCAVTLAARDPVLAARRFEDRVAVVAAPPWTFRRIGRPSETMADVLLSGGFGDPTVITPRLRMCRDLMASVRPDLLVSDFSPGANMAACGVAPVVVLGSGFTVPPAGPPLPFHPDQPPSRDVRQREATLLNAVNQAARLLGLPPVVGLSDLLRGDRALVLTWSMLDPYAAFRRDATLTPYTLPTLPPYRRFAERPEGTVFVYLPQAHPQIAAALGAIAAAGLRGLVYLRGQGASQRLPPGLTLLPQPADLAEILPTIRLLIHSGGLGLAHAGLAAGVAQVLLPTCMEQELTARALARLRIAAAFSAPHPLATDPITAVFRRVEQTPAISERLDRLAAACPADGADSLRRVLATIGGMLGRDLSAPTNSHHDRAAAATARIR